MPLLIPDTAGVPEVRQFLRLSYGDMPSPGRSVCPHADKMPPCHDEGGGLARGGLHKKNAQGLGALAFEGPALAYGGVP